MNIITYNVRGLGRGVKWPAIRRMVKKQHIDMFFFFWKAKIDIY